MKFIASPGDHHDERFYLTSFQRSREGVIVEAKFPPEVEKAVSLVSEYFSMNKLPVASLDFGGHGSAGLIFNKRKGLTRGKDLNTDFDVYSLMARISFGPSHKNNKKIEKIGWNPTNVDRFHISVHGGRQFFPKNIPELYESSCVTSDLATVTEEVHFSWRSEGNKFDDWNNLDEWFAEKDSQYLNNKKFNELRTTHLDSQFNLANREKEKSVRDHLNHFGRKEQSFATNLSFNQYSKRFEKYSPQDLLKMWGRLHDRGTVPIVGYAPALLLLSIFGNVSQEDYQKLPKFTKIQAVNYVFGKILPAIDNFVNS